MSLWERLLAQFGGDRLAVMEYMQASATVRPAGSTRPSSAAQQAERQAAEYERTAAQTTDPTLARGYRQLAEQARHEARGQRSHRPPRGGIRRQWPDQPQERLGVRPR